MRNSLCLLLCLGLLGCDDGGGDDAGVDPDRDAGRQTDAGPDGVDAGPDDVDAGPGGDVDAGPGGDVDAGPPSACDFQTVGGMIVIEAESLRLTEDWVVSTDNAGFTGSGYIEWTGRSFNNDPTHGPISTALRFDAAGLYRLQWHTRIGRGDNPTEHNDTWVRFMDAADFYGSQGPLTAEDRVYPDPICMDNAFMMSVRAMPDVAEATCPNGSTSMGFFKVYSSGARDWRWSTNTSDNDAHQIIVQIDTPGVYTMELAARADFSQIDRIVIHDTSLDNGAVRDLANPETPCP